MTGFFWIMGNEIIDFIKEYNLDGGEAMLASQLLRSGKKPVQVIDHLIQIGSEEMIRSLRCEVLAEAGQFLLYANYLTPYAHDPNIASRISTLTERARFYRQRIDEVIPVRE